MRLYLAAFLVVFLSLDGFMHVGVVQGHRKGESTLAPPPPSRCRCIPLAPFWPAGLVLCTTATFFFFILQIYCARSIHTTPFCASQSVVRHATAMSPAAVWQICISAHAYLCTNEVYVCTFFRKRGVRCPLPLPRYMAHNARVCCCVCVCVCVLCNVMGQCQASLGQSWPRSQTRPQYRPLDEGPSCCCGKTSW